MQEKLLGIYYFRSVQGRQSACHNTPLILNGEKEEEGGSYIPPHPTSLQPEFIDALNRSEKNRKLHVMLVHYLYCIMRSSCGSFRAQTAAALVLRPRILDVSSLQQG
jgi:hypothetical protein